MQAQQAAMQAQMNAMNQQNMAAFQQPHVHHTNQLTVRQVLNKEEEIKRVFDPLFYIDMVGNYQEKINLVSNKYKYNKCTYIYIFV